MEAGYHNKRPRSHIDDPTDSFPSTAQHPPNDRSAKRARPPTGVSTEQQITIHCVHCSRTHEYHKTHRPATYYLDIPALAAGANRTTALQGQDVLLDVENYLAECNGFSFVVYLDYDCEAYHDRMKDTFIRLRMPSMPQNLLSECKPYFQVLEDPGPPAEASSERLQLSDSLKEALRALRELDTGRFRAWNFREDLIYPYPKLYHCRHLFVPSALQTLEPPQQQDLRILFNYLNERLTSDYEELTDLSTTGVVNQKHWMMLFQPGDVVITTQNDQHRAYVVTSCRLMNQTTLSLECWFWGYDGNFFREHNITVIKWPSKSNLAAITELLLYPIRFATAGIESKLRERGHTFWGCRQRKYVSYDVPLQGLGSQLTNLRYMVDMEAYRLMHGRDDDPPRQSELADDTLKNDECPDGSFALLLPETINGYGFHNKKWNVLLVEHIRDIEWNTGVFDHRLVLQEGKKELVKALVTVHIEKSRTIKTDFMDGKGEGLIVLLHGGPGTGKTLTAESIAELVERPLYRVTCGDIGTDAESVERYLESALFIGSTWDCVVLLDEADVFLEERTKMDLQRNALVSVFLRVLEYYDGILILTTNRIGTFDEAFKSRIQLALHYPPLDRDGRWEVWRNFVQSLSETGEKINTEEISKKLDILARHKLNGRQIRNTVNTARQLACYKKETIRYAHIDQAIGVVNEFEKYVTDVHGHDDEEYAQDQGLRNDHALRDGD